MYMEVDLRLIFTKNVLYLLSYVGIQCHFTDFNIRYLAWPHHP